MQRNFMIPAIDLTAAHAAVGRAGVSGSYPPPLKRCNSVIYALMARTIPGTFQSQAGLGRAFSCSLAEQHYFVVATKNVHAILRSLREIGEWLRELRAACANEKKNFRGLAQPARMEKSLSGASRGLREREKDCLEPRATCASMEEYSENFAQYAQAINNG